MRSDLDTLRIPPTSGTGWEAFHILFEALDDAALILDEQGVLLEANGAACSLYGLDALDRSHLRFQDLQVQDPGPNLLHRHRDGRSFPVVLKVRPLTEDSRTLVLVRPVEPSQPEAHAALLERTRQEAETKSILLQEVNHRVKNNLTGILGMVDMELQASLKSGSPLCSSFEDLKNRIYSLATVHELLSASEWAPLRLDNLASELIRNTLAGSVTGRHVRLSVVGRERIMVVPTVATALAVILAELTTNSLKYAFRKHGQGHLTLRIRPTGDAWNRVCMTFQDDGPGFPPEVLNGTESNVGLRLIRLNVKNLLRGEVELDNQRGAKVTLTFQPMPLPRRDPLP